MSTPSKPETQLARAVVEAVEALGVPIIRIQSGKVPLRGRWMHLAPRGTPDFWTPLGWLEIKTNDGELSEAQKLWKSQAEHWGVRVATIRDAQTAVTVVGQWLQAYRFDRAQGWR